MTSHQTSRITPLSSNVLRALFELAQADIACDAGVVARLLGVGVRDVARCLLSLDTRGLACSDRARLTLLGLAHAARLPALGRPLPVPALARPATPARALRMRGSVGLRVPHARLENHGGTAGVSL